MFVLCCIYIPHVDTFRVVGLTKKFKKKRQKKVFNSFALWQVLQIALPDLLILLKNKTEKFEF